ncbi:MAG: Wzz/FepE/Etk N-terminal domain-containing protein [Candidatus Latescibacterota bacterium]
MDYIEVPLKHKWLIVGGTLLCMLAAVAYSLSQPRTFQAEALVVVSPAIRRKPGRGGAPRSGAYRTLHGRADLPGPRQERRADAGAGGHLDRQAERH